MKTHHSIITLFSFIALSLFIFSIGCPGKDTGLAPTCAEGFVFMNDQCLTDEEAEQLAAAEDGDGDGYTSAVDCDDSNADINPGATEICDGFDNDCDEEVDSNDDSLQAATYYPDTDGDGYGDSTTSITACDRLDGYVEDNTDCDDSNPGINPETVENSASGNDGDGIDNDCDGTIDESGITTRPGGTMTRPEDDDDGEGGETTKYIMKLKFWVKNMDDTGAGVSKENWEATKLNIDFKRGPDFSCTFGEMSITRPPKLGSKSETGTTHVDLKVNKSCFSPAQADWEGNVQIDNIKEISFEATEAAPFDWGIAKINFTAIYDDESTEKFYINNGVWAYVGHKSSAANHYPKPAGCIVDGAYGGFDKFNTIGDEGHYKADWFQNKTPKSTVAFRPNDYWVRFKLSTQDISKAGTNDHLFVRFDCTTYLELRDLGRDKTRYFRFYTPNSKNGKDFENFKLKIENDDNVKLDLVDVKAHQAWSTTGRRTTYRKYFTNKFTIDNSTDIEEIVMTEGTESFN